MFRRKRQQRSLFDHDVYLPDERVAALEKTWAGPFRHNILPLIDEDPFEPFYCPDNGRSNVPVAILIGLCILKEWRNLTDAELLGSLEWDIRYQFALDVNAKEADVCQKTLHNFRVLVTTNRMAEKVFADITGKIIREAGLSTAKQRLDSTHVVSNMANLSRLGLFVRTMEKFLTRLQKAHPETFSRLPAMYREVYLERAGYFADVKSSKAKRRLEKCARHLFDLVDRFRGDHDVEIMHDYRLMTRLLDEQCEITENAAEPVVLKKPADVSAESLQNPSDPDATYGHKGKGYKASLAETCGEKNTFQVITDVALENANQPDAKDVVPVLERLEAQDTKPEELFADAGYGSGENLLHAKERGVDLSAPMTSGSKPQENHVHIDDFVFDLDWTRVLACIKDHAPAKTGLTPNGKDVFAVFEESACGRCEFNPVCPIKRHKNGTFRLRVARKTVASASRRCEQETELFKKRYKIRSGIEATISEANRLTSFKRSWTRGRMRFAASICFKALAINVKRYVQNEAEKAQKAINNVVYLSKSAAQRQPCSQFFVSERNLLLAA